MKPSQRPTYPGVHETIPNPYPPTGSMLPEPQPPLGFINQGNHAQVGQVTFITSPAIFDSSQPCQGNIQMANPATGTAAVNFKEEAKTLGAIQIIIGLLHIGFGAVLGSVSINHYSYWGFTSIAFIGGYPFWGGVCFIISGSLSIAASKDLSSCLIKGSLGMNIVSSIFALTGVILLLVDLSINDQIHQNIWAWRSKKGISAMLMIFSFLEFSINCTVAHFANQTIMHTNRSVLVVPQVCITNPVAQELPPAPPMYDGLPAYAPRH
uniref:membrane-spanning 4-domains subfamily A member 12 n=1 Tax=Jaculus jaculus TaxID=51337 RepID=UPI001E1B5FB5|nr:membrane-spanning 4-domains subfamily A member 12 [Jaculus jaculus]